MSDDVKTPQENKGTLSTQQRQQGIVTVTDFCDVSAKAKLLGLNDPDGLALLPRNFENATAFDELLHESTVHDVRTLFRQKEIPETRIERHGQKIPVILEKRFDLVLPAIFVGELILSQNPHLLALALSVIANYATDFFKGIPGPNEVALNIIDEMEDENGKRKRYKKIKYKGPVEGLPELRKIAKEVFTNEDTC